MPDPDPRATAAPLLLAVDGGTQSTKVLLVDARGTVHARAQVALQPLDRRDEGVAEHPGDDLWESLVAAVRSLLRDWGGDPARVVGLGLCSIRCCQVLLDETGQLVAPVRSWMDARTWHPWADDEHAEDPRVATVGAASAYLTARLTGRRADAAAAYDQVWLAANQLPAALLPTLVAPGEPLGPLTEDASRLLGLEVGLPVVATGNDKAVEALGGGLVEETDDVLLSLGTYAAAMTPVAEGSARAEAAAYGASTWLNEACPAGTRLAETGGVRHGMGTVTWTADLLGADVADLARAAAEVPAGARDLVCVPDWLAPGDQPWRRGALVGLTGAHGRAEVARAVVEGLLLTLADHVRAAEADLGGRFARLVLTGGGARSELLTAIAAAACDLPVVRPVETDAAGMGAAVCAAVGTGVHPDWSTAVKSMVGRRAPVAPDPDLVAAYARLAPRHRALRDGVAGLLQRL
ncbi:hypothetical protein KLP28_11870 [Nocardioidaceae bacterium]|nr:hypothetical protein KLP28_11870 [Nocardioidaceae bacterium]